MKFISHSEKETKEIAKKLVSHLRLSSGGPRKIKGAVVIGLSGDLGAGKTTFTKSFAKALGVKETVKSPTFNILKNYELRSKNFDSKLKTQNLKLVHMDVYRINNPKDILNLGWKKLIKDPNNIILVEWAEKIKKIMPAKSFNVNLTHLGYHKRGLDIKLVR